MSSYSAKPVAVVHPSALATRLAFAAASVATISTADANARTAGLGGLVSRQRRPRIAGAPTKAARGDLSSRKLSGHRRGGESSSPGRVGGTGHAAE